MSAPFSQRPPGTTDRKVTLLRNNLRELLVGPKVEPEPQTTSPADVRHKLLFVTPNRESPKRSETTFDREEWRRGLQDLDPAARAAMAKVAASKERPDPLDIDRMVAGLGAEAELDDSTA
jgi:hypothetical protein